MTKLLFKFIVIFSLMSLFLTPSASFASCAEELARLGKWGPGVKITDNLQSDAHAFMVKSGLIQDGNERKISNDISTQWRIVDSKEFVSHDLLIMNVQTTAYGATENGDVYDVVVLDKNSDRSSENKFEKFEDVFQVPSELFVAIGGSTPDYDGTTNKQLNYLPKDLYYVRLTGKSAVAALKSVYANISYAGFSGDLTQDDGKESFDPTPNRTWRIKNATFDLRRGSTAEIHDVRPIQLDIDFQSYFKGSTGHVAPWGAAFIRKILVNGKWVEVIKEQKQ